MPAAPRSIDKGLVAPSAINSFDPDTDRPRGETRCVRRHHGFDDELSALVHELSEPLTAVANYLAAARRVLGTDAGSEDCSLTEILEKASAQTDRAGEIVHRVRQLLRSDIAAAKDPTVQPGRSPEGV